MPRKTKRDEGNDGVFSQDKKTFAQRRKVRKKFHAILEDATENKNDLMNPDSNHFTKKLAEADKVFRKHDGVIGANEALADAKVLSFYSKIGVDQAHHLEGEFSSFTPKEYAQRIQSKFAAETRDGIDWDAIAQATSFIHTPAVSFMYGPLSSVAAKQESRKGRTVLKRHKLKAVVGTEKVDVAEDDEDELTSRVAALAKALQENKAVNFYDLVVQPDSFAETVERMFDFSVLVKFKKAQLNANDNGELTADFIPDERGTQSGGGTGRKQCIMKMDWRLFKDLAKVREAPRFEPPKSQQSFGTIDSSKSKGKGKQRVQ